MMDVVYPTSSGMVINLEPKPERPLSVYAINMRITDNMVCTGVSCSNSKIIKLKTLDIHRTVVYLTINILNSLLPAADIQNW